MGKRRKAVTAQISAEGFAKIAAEVVPGHAGWMAEGYELTEKGRMWRRRDGSWTGRFVYSMPGPVRLTIVTVIRGIVFA